MDITKLKWTKNIKAFYPTEEEKWAYRQVKVDETFKLHWRNKNKQDEKNARKPSQGELILLRQLGFVTHIVKLLDSEFSFVQENTDNEFNIYRHVEVIWINDNWEAPPRTKEFFEPKIQIPRSGKAYQIERLKAFKLRWGDAGLADFQKHIFDKLQIIHFLELV